MGVPIFLNSSIIESSHTIDSEKSPILRFSSSVIKILRGFMSL